ncbi:GFA family protein [Shimia aestuarii]|uniref:Uncharacterized conserved protein n=1 Tax=Shimia aestuarii TaxID=254406 RepID=A0A1I4LHH4_9RHOB|nr:GFA family protein [Shimia aestuarii]SFL90286.1 Uncharacterized conserved protein [Shimia aestuarii]
MTGMIEGGCLCGATSFEIENDFAFLLFCHCEQCRKLSGSAMAANLFSTTRTLRWVRGEAHVTKFRHPDRQFSRAFCNQCGSALPFEGASGRFVIVPAGALEGAPQVTKRAEVFTCERANWELGQAPAETFEGFPTYFDT